MHVINDNYGMPVGDRLIAKLGELIRTRLVPGALAARISGDRFALLLPTGEEDAVHFAEALRAGVEKISVVHLGGDAADASFQASVSIGVAALIGAARRPGACAGHGRNRLQGRQGSRPQPRRGVPGQRPVADPPLRGREHRAQRCAPRMTEGRAAPGCAADRAAAGNGGDKPHFELLLRMIDDNGEVVGPGRFLSAAKRYQLMPEVDRWVIGETLGKLAPHAQLLADAPVVFTVNLSGQSLGEAEFADDMIDADPAAAA